MGANPNVVHGDDGTALMMACEAEVGPHSLLMVRELLEAGADPTMANATQQTALHIAASHERGSDLIRVLTAKAPATLVNRLDNEGKTALSYAAHYGQEAAVSSLLSAGANDQEMLNRTGDTSLRAAVYARHEGVVRKMVGSKSNFNAVGGRPVLAKAIALAVMEDAARIVYILLNVEGEGKQRFWARATKRCAGDGTNVSAFEIACVEGIPTLHLAASYGAVRSIRLLLAAGADEMSLDGAGNCVSEVIGISLSPDVRDPIRRCAAVARELKRAPAFRARSWAWPATVACGEGDAGEDRASGDNAASPDPTNRAPLGVRVFRPRCGTSWCVRLFSRQEGQNRA